MGSIRKQLRQRLELERLSGADSLPRLNRLGTASREANPEPAPVDAEPSPDPSPAQRQAPAAAAQGGDQIAGIETVPPLDPADDTAAQLLAMDVDEVRGCTKCPLARTRRKTVFGEGSPHASLVFVGEAPGADEDAHGRPFVGRAGKLLEDIIVKGMRLSRHDVFICNVLKCRPPDNRTPQPDEVAACSPFLWRQLSLIDPRVIVCLGASAAQALLKTTEPIGRLRGLVHNLQLDPMAPPIPTICTYHPAYLLRNYTRDARAKVWDDIQKAMKIAGIPVPGK
ncbi:MAG: hypothetical protein BIFFINMI_03874 [Phycisphaerae bacterium]|nr:hypothetical protein [Phycisphaerae bacterium]